MTMMLLETGVTTFSAVGLAAIGLSFAVFIMYACYCVLRGDRYDGKNDW